MTEAGFPSPVLIVGAGPTGLAAAMSLARARIPVRLIDRSPQPARHSRAIGIQARTLELLEQHRIVEPFLELGHRAHAANLYSNGQRRVRLDFDPLLTRYPYLLFIDQTVTERLLAGHLETLGVQIERSVELLEFAQGSAGVTAQLRLADGRIETLRTPYLIAADGAHSTVRHQLDMKFDGDTLEQSFLLADIDATTPWPDDEFHVFASGDGLAALFPFGKGRFRLIADHKAMVPQAPEGATPLPTLDECREIVQRRVHHPVLLSDMTWSSYFRINSRMVRQLRAERVFFAGDAAHVHSPAGAQGMNTGIQEAFNLGWKLARVMTGGAPDRLLDTYHAERYPIERIVLRQTSFMTQLVEADHGPMKLLRERVMPVLVALGPLRDAARQAVSELSIQYRRSPLTLERVLDGGPRAGERAPDALVHVVDGPLGKAPGKGRVFDLHDPASFSLFLLVDPEAARDADETEPQAAPVDDDLARFAQAVEQRLPQALRVWRISDLPDGDAPPPGGGAPQSLSEAYGRARPAFYLVRPDGYLCARGRPASDLNALLRHCETWFAASASAQPAPR
ncbi:FAD-dependent monooxygenase [Paraburkholderia caballeronis]|uniref:2-polyprenyl-6-methoxyphenol hydroxylase n=1 Tax=Paraburkholderia caballeronis TaxID=416943 RepID=A0A1H7URT6_9BURK|nr:FAD-dependent monooxygenase [Paraburkholderia caballeronis]PXW26654.1 2-polyprenyl-6-methoxyphenol hydroxylase-like FAD-dependent oxidoreductase [Paraburkholderia caballeronis]PXX02200.1 2-polyprenyl-6-methoxyphenol hydroxylase-like FAD-dependent oxidoreductase [Paraburkholderia caballeronis]RAK01357.1 2-polyprenyl-6-methoxyphenol hydroxylase-like FAD-dependent oxidoreductase [Paraburkholderia caballeronis]SEB83238.1 2-polyprenyl-6-methoxyphenol hydroxylase [Paraburkholderia caballeronis]SE